MKTAFLLALLITLCCTFWGLVGFSIARAVGWVDPPPPADEMAKIERAKAASKDKPPVQHVAHVRSRG